MNAAIEFSVLLLTLVCKSMTSQLFHIINVTPVANRRLGVTPRDVMTQSSYVECAITCRLSSWCVSANVSPDRSTCQLLSQEVSDVMSLEPAPGWSYLRKYTYIKRRLISAESKLRSSSLRWTIYKFQCKNLTFELCFECRFFSKCTNNEET